jgi:hypothetical protein
MRRRGRGQEKWGGTTLCGRLNEGGGVSHNALPDLGAKPPVHGSLGLLQPGERTFPISATPLIVWRVGQATPSDPPPRHYPATTGSSAKVLIARRTEGRRRPPAQDCQPVAATAIVHPKHVPRGGGWSEGLETWSRNPRTI